MNLVDPTVVIRIPPVKAVASLVALVAPYAAIHAAYTDAEKLFALEVKPILQQKCFACHGGDKMKAGLDMTSREELLYGSFDHEDVLVPGDAENSLMYIASTWSNPDYEMPPKEADRLTEEQTWLIRDWIDAGAPWPSAEDELAILEQYAEGVIVATSGGLDDNWTNRRYEKEDVWAYQAVRDTELPMADEHPIDAFIDAGLEKLGLPPADATDRRTLIRRATYDLIGLPPTQADVEAFINDPRPDKAAFAAVVDRLLADPRYGEQWGRHWLDVVRYADSSGFSNDYERPNAWRYRDYVIRAFNEDKPFDDFIREQVAGDELDPGNPDAIIATGFLRMGPWEHTAMSVARITRQQFLDDVTNSIGEVFLSHPLKCARCHDHKFDPIPTKDYYRIQAVFATTYFADRKLPFQEYETLSGFDERQVMEKRSAYFRNMRDTLDKKSQLAHEQWCREQGIPVKSRRELEKLGFPPEKIPPRNIGLSMQELGVMKVGDKNVKRTQFEMKKFEPFAMSVYSGPTPAKPQSSGTMLSIPKNDDPGGAISKTHILTNGDPFGYADEVSPGVMSALPGSNDTVEETAFNAIPDSATGRRLAFAEWLASPVNSIVPRSMVNRIWHYHFGQGIVDTPNNFGAMGGKPSHPELLDFLASRFVESGWSVKAMHKLIMTSDAYQRSTEYSDRGLLAELDLPGKSYAVFKPRRLSAEELRDSMLFVSGELNATIGGLPALPEINHDVATQPRQVMGSFAASYEPARTPEERNRRSIYAKKIRGLRNPFMEVFNQPGPDESCEARESSNVTPQVFSLFNGEDSLKRSIATALDLTQKNASREAAVTDLFQRAFNRDPDAAELQLCLDHWSRMRQRHDGLTFQPKPLPREVHRNAVEEMSGESFEFTEILFGYDNYVPDPGMADVDSEIRALADLCLVVFNSNEFAYIY